MIQFWILLEELGFWMMSDFCVGRICAVQIDVFWMTRDVYCYGEISLALDSDQTGHLGF